MTTGKFKVLVVEDSRFFVSVLRKGLVNRLGLEMVQVGTRAEARELLAREAESFIVALLDLHLPDAQCGEIVDDVLPYRIPAIVFTGMFSDEIREFVLSKNVVDYVTKDSPGSFETVLEIVERILRNQGIRILVVDDSGVSRHYIGNLLTLHRFQVVEAAGGREALAALDAHPDIRLAIVDYNMQGMDGIELTRRMRAKYSRHDLVVIGLSAYGNNIVSAHFMKSGANDYMNKPFVPEEFFCRIYQNLDVIQYIASLRKTEALLTETMRTMERNSAAKTKFLSHLNHELGTPLNAVIGFSQMLLETKKSPLDEAQRQWTESILGAGRLLHELVTDALDIARIEADRLELDDGAVALGLLCQEAMILLHPLAGKTGVTLVVEAEGDGPTVIADRRRLTQVILNFGSNAVKFSNGGGVVRIGTGVTERGEPFIAVADTGLGMDEAGIAIALEPFGQSGPMELRRKGTGLGLPLAKALVERHAGRVQIESQLGRGTTVTAILPADRLCPDPAGG